MTASERAAMRAALPAVDEDERASLIAEAMQELWAGDDDWIVQCEDGLVRHTAPFPSRGDAQQFAYWGHCCTASHLIFRNSYTNKEGSDT